MDKKSFDIFKRKEVINMKDFITILLVAALPMAPVALHTGSATTPTADIPAKLLSSQEMAESGGALPLMFIAAVLAADAVLLAGLMAYHSVVVTEGGGGCMCGGCDCGCF